MEPHRSSPAGPPAPVELSADPLEPRVTPGPEHVNGVSITPEPTSPPPKRESELRYWMRPLVLSALVIALLGLTLWDARRVPDRPLPPSVLTATPPAGATVSTSDPGLTDMLSRLRLALSRRDAAALAKLADPEGVVVAAYGGGLPDTGFTVTDTQRLAQETLAGSQLSLLGWRNDGRGRVIVLADGWARKPLRLSPNGTLELEPLGAIGLAPRNGTWYWRWLLPDSTGTLAQQARSTVWQDVSQLGVR